MAWSLLLADEGIVRSYRDRVHTRGEDACAYWLGALSSTGHGKLRAGRRPDGTSTVVSAHTFGYRLEYGLDALEEGAVVRHICDEAACQNPRHWRAGQRADNIADYYARRHLAGGPLADVRGPRGRAVAIRAAIQAAAPDEVEAAIAAAVQAGHPAGGQQTQLF
ncbi:hypothetical protein [Streptomyces sp. G-5]|uniref:hypothetical protein n=1 Tax=Streptomyces sp. G-5 TaxID=2977231 RepID=UPI0021D16AF8|nr:hypothetical protein [Streptomyces sp. G-5]MCU4750278.1 hypothetical protein [Streptomyces sp. G-5]